MRDTLQIIGMVIAIIIACIGYGLSVYRAVTQNLSDGELLEKLTFTSAVSASILMLFVIISLLF